MFERTIKWVIMMNLLICLILWLEEKKLKKAVDFPKEIL
jgi:hypothetical protein